MKQARLEIIALTMAVLLPTPLVSQVCSKGNEYLVGKMGIPLSTNTIWFLGDSIHAAEKGNDGVTNLNWDARLSPDGLVQRVTWRVIPVSELHLVIPGKIVDGAFANLRLTTTTTDAGKTPVVRRSPAPQGAMPMVAGAPMFLEILLRRARKIGGDDVVIPLVWVELDGFQDLAHLRHVGADSMVLASTRGDIRMSLSKEGSLLTALDAEGTGMKWLRCVN